MEIKTNFKVGQTVSFLDGTKLKSLPVDSIKINIQKNKVDIDYYFKEITGKGFLDYEFHIRKHDEVFSSKEEFFNQL